MPPVPFPFIDGCVKSVWSFLSDTGVEAHCVVNWIQDASGSTPIPDSEVEDLRVAVDGEITSTIAGLYDANWQLEQVTFQAIDVPFQTEIVSSYNLAGTRAGDALPTQVACIASLRSTLNGRRGRGRNFWPFGTDADITDQLWNTSFTTAVASFIEDIDVAAQGLSVPYKLAVASHTYGVVNQVIAVVVDTVPDIQRRRRPKP